MTATDGPSIPDVPSLASWSAEAVLAHFLASPTGQRFRACDPLDVWEGLRPAIRLAAAIELAGLGARRALRVHYLGHGFEDARDDGRWLQMAKYFLPGHPRLEISMLTAPEVERGRHATASTLATFVAALSPARRRTASRDALFEPLRCKADLVIVSPRPFIWETDYRPLADVIPAESSIVLADEADAATLAVAQFLDDIGGSTENRWIDALDDPDAPDDDDEPRLAHGALLAHLRRHPDRAPATEVWRACQEQVPWSIRLLMAARKTRFHVPLWPGCRFPTERESGEIADTLFAHPDVYVDAATGEALDLPNGHSFTLPSEILATHPAGSRHPRNRACAAEIAWARLASAALHGCHLALLQLDDDLQARLAEHLQELGESPPPEDPLEVTGLFAAVHREDHDGIVDRIMLRRVPPDQRGPHGVTPLMLAARLGRTLSLGVLLECHASAHLRDDHGWTALAHAAYCGHVQAVALLLHYGRGSDVRLGSGVPEIVFCLVMLSAYRRAGQISLRHLPDASEVIRAWREGALQDTDIAAIRATLASPDDAAPPALAAPSGDAVPTSHPVAIPEPVRPASTLAYAVRQAISDPHPAHTPPTQTWAATPPQPALEAAAAPAADPQPDPVTASLPAIEPQPTPPAETGRATPAPRPASPPTSAPRVLGTMSVVATVAGTLGHLDPTLSPSDTAEVARHAVLAWLRSDKGLPLPDPLDDVFQIDLPDATVLTDAVPGLWTLRYDDRDRAVPGRTWRTEVVIGTTPERAFASMRLVRVSPSPEDTSSTSASIPRLVSRVAARIGLSDAGVPLRADPWVIASEDGIEALMRLLLDPARLQPVLVVTSRDPSWIGVAAESGALAAKLHGFAHLVVVHPSMTFTLSRELGRPLSVFGDACRLYRPGFTADDDAHSNPLFLRRGDTPPRPLVSRIVQTAATLAPSRVTEEEVPTFAFARALMARSRQAPPSPAQSFPSVERVQVLEQSILALTAERDTWQQSYGELDAMARSREDELLLDRESLREEIARLRSQNFHLRAQNDQLRVTIARKAGAEPTPVTYPDTWDVLETWAADVLGDDVVLSNKAVRAARKSPFQNIPLAYQALHLLKDWYLPMRLDRTPETVEAFAARCRELALEISDTGQAVDDRRFKESYRVTWMGRTYKLDQHVSGSSSRDRSLQFRLYFAFDQEQGTIIVGAFPEHMENSLTRR